jgi:hypothetical protein
VNDGAVIPWGHRSVRGDRSPRPDRAATRARAGFRPSAEEVAEWRGVSPDTVGEWCRLGRIRATKRESGQGPARPWLIAHAELERLENEGLLPLRIVMD